MKIICLTLFLLTSISIFAQDTNWDKLTLKEHWVKNGIDEIEGIYESILIDAKTPKYELGLIRNDELYCLIYISGSTVGNSKKWNTGDIKAYLTPTGTPNLFKAKWYLGDKTVTEDLYVTIENGMMHIVWNDDSVEYLLIKLFPSAQDNIKKSRNPSAQSSGSGFGISTDGMIATSFHVIDGATTIKVRGINQNFSKTYTARVLIADKNNDLAIIQINDLDFTQIDSIPYVLNQRFSDVGTSVFVLGYPLRASMGDEIKLTNGIISSQSGFQGDITSYQISAPVQPGNSGGPLFDSNGNVIGIVNAKHNLAENASYAIKSDYLSILIKMLSKNSCQGNSNQLKDKSLSQQVEIIKKFVYIIETE